MTRARVETEAAWTVALEEVRHDVGEVALGASVMVHLVGLAIRSALRVAALGVAVTTARALARGDRRPAPAPVAG